jgi:hypothetical protein
MTKLKLPPKPFVDLKEGRGRFRNGDGELTMLTVDQCLA